MRRFHARTGLLCFLSAVFLSACGGGDEGGPDTRCAGVAQVPAWRVEVGATFNDLGIKDSFDIRLHHTFTAADTTGAGIIDGNSVAWFGGVPSGTLAMHDTIINTNANDTTAGIATTFAPSPAGPGVYVSVDLASCAMAVGALVYAPVSLSTNGVSDGVDTLMVGYPFGPLFQANEMTMTAGVLVGPITVGSVTANAPFGSGAWYRVGGLNGPYVAGGATAVLDDASVSFLAYPLAVAPAAGGTAAPFVGQMHPNGAIVPRTPR